VLLLCYTCMLYNIVSVSAFHIVLLFTPAGGELSVLYRMCDIKYVPYIISLYC
jgi:hypothetical protein